MPNFHHPFSTYWMKKADEWLSMIVRSIGHCEKCPKPGYWEEKSKANTGGLENHHILEKSVYLAYRYLKINSICLCTFCHTEAESDKEGFAKWLEENRSDTYIWMQQAEKSKNSIQINYQRIAEQLKAQYMELLKTSWMDLEVDLPPGVIV